MSVSVEAVDLMFKNEKSLRGVELERSKFTRPQAKHTRIGLQLSCVVGNVGAKKNA